MVDVAVVRRRILTGGVAFALLVVAAPSPSSGDEPWEAWEAVAPIEDFCLAPDGSAVVIGTAGCDIEVSCFGNASAGLLGTDPSGALVGSCWDIDWTFRWRPDVGVAEVTEAGAGFGVDTAGRVVLRSTAGTGTAVRVWWPNGPVVTLDGGSASPQRSSPNGHVVARDDATGATVVWEPGGLRHDLAPLEQVLVVDDLGRVTGREDRASGQDRLVRLWLDGRREVLAEVGDESSALATTATGDLVAWREPAPVWLGDDVVGIWRSTGGTEEVVLGGPVWAIDLSPSGAWQAWDRGPSGVWIGSSATSLMPLTCPPGLSGPDVDAVDDAGMAYGSCSDGLSRPVRWQRRSGPAPSTATTSPATTTTTTIARTASPDAGDGAAPASGGAPEASPVHGTPRFTG